MAQKVYGVVLTNMKTTGIELLNNAAKIFLERKPDVKHGKQSIKDLSKQRAELQDIPMDGKDVKAFERQLKKNGVDYAVKKDLTKPNSFVVFFKARDISLIDNALKNYTAIQFTKSNKPSIKNRIKQAIDKAAKNRNEFKQEKTKSLGAR